VVRGDVEGSIALVGVRTISTMVFVAFLQLTLRKQADTIPAMNQPFAFGFYFYFSKLLRPQLAEEVDLL
jgi:hypothetical protein